MGNFLPNSKLKQLAQTSYHLENQQLNLGKLLLTKKQRIEDWVKILKVKNWQDTKKLTIGLCQINDAKLKEILKFKWPSLQHLNLSYNEISQIGSKQIVKYNWPNLKKLWLYQNNIRNEGLQYLLQFGQKNMDDIGIGNNNITFEGVHLFLKYETAHIKVLAINDNNIGSKGIKILIKADLPFLEQLYISKCEIGDRGITHITKSNWENLALLEIGNNLIYFTGFQIFYRNNLKKMKQFNFIGWDGTPEQGENLQYGIEFMELLTIQKYNLRINSSNEFCLQIENKQLNESLNFIFEHKFVQNDLISD